MENSVGDVLQCEERLKSTLHCDDKEKLRRKLALLQREYLRTAQKLQRAERLDAVRRHVRSRVTQHNHQDQRDPELTSNPCLNPSLLMLNATSETAQDGHNEGPADSDSSKRSQVIRFLLPTDAACPQTPDLSHDVARGHRPSPAMRLRSRRSRLRWERRSTESTEAGRMTDKSKESQEQSDKREAIRIEGEKEKIKSEEPELLNDKELFSASDSSESPSLLLKHWNTYASTETRAMEGKEIEAHQEPRGNESDLRDVEEKPSESTPLPLEAYKTDTHIEEGGQDGTQNGRIEQREPGEEEQNESEKIEHEKRHVDTMEIKEEKSGTEDGKSVGLLDCCTLVEGLLFPVEYYVRTTRRMTFSQSQPDMQAVILSQLSTGRQRRGRGRRSVLNRKTQTNEPSNEHTQADSLATTPIQPPKLSHVQAAGFSADLTGSSQSSSEILDQLSGSQNKRNHFSSPADCSYRSGRGRRRKRGRGRGRPHTPRSSLGLDTSNLGSAQPTRTPVSPPRSHYSADEAASCLSSQEAVAVINDDLPTSSHTTPSHISSEMNEAQSRTMTAQLETVYPIVLKSNIRNNRHTEINGSTSTWRSLPLPSSPSTQTCFHSVPFRSLGSMVSSLVKFDIQQDFHLPDDQFGSLKLNKLRQVAVESAVERFTSPYNTRNSKRLSNSSCTASSDPVMPFPLPLSLTPTITKSPRFTGDEQPATQTVDLENLSVDHKLENQSSAEVSPDTADAPGDQQTENLPAKTLTTSPESVSPVDHLAADCVNRCKEPETVILNSCNKSSILISSRDRPAGKVNVTEHSNEPKMKESTTERQTDCICAVHSLEERRSEEHQTEQNIITKTQQETPEEVSYSCAAGETCNDSEALGDSTVKDLSVKSPAKDLKQPSEGTTSPAGDKSVETKHLEHHCARSQLLLSPPLASASCAFMSSSAFPSSPTLPSLGLTPQLASPQTSSPSAPTLRLPPLHIQAVSPPVLSPCPSCTSLPSSLPPASPSSQNPSSLGGCHRVDPPPCPSLSGMQSQGPGELMNQGIKESANERMLRPPHTLKAPAGSCLVDACCLPAPSGGLCVAAAGKWAVCLWSPISASDWRLTHTWTFNETVINVFPVPDAADLMCVTLGQLEIREVRVLSCSFLSQVLLYEGVVQAVVGVSKSRVVLSSYSATGSSLQVFNLSDSISTPASQHLVSPGVCIGALAPVDGLPDALIGTDECGHLFIWNLNTRQVLQRVTFGDDLSHTACLRGFSYCGVLFVLLQHQLLSSLEEEEKEAKAKDQMFSDEEEEAEKKKTAVFSLVAVNPLSGKSVLATKLYPPKAWSGRLCEADVNSFSVVGLSQSGCVCVWELIRQGDPRMVWAPEGEGWQLARWGRGDVLVTGHLSGDVTLHCYSHNSPCC